MKLLQAAQITGYQRRKDRSVRLSFVTQEIQDITLIDRMASDEAAGILYFRADDQMKSNPEELEELDNIDLDLYDKRKTQSQRLRAVLYLNWEQYFKDHIPFKDYYKNETERLIQNYKDKLQ
jgi:hypothetical protein